MRHFHRSIDLPVPRDELFAWHARPGAFERLAPSWQRLEVVAPECGIMDGARLEFVVHEGPLRSTWVARHRGYVFGEKFEDVHERSPFTTWHHVHRFEALGPNRSRLDDHLDYSIPFLKRWVDRRVVRIFRQRHIRLAIDLRRHLAEGDPSPRKIAITGASGLIGRPLSAFLRSGGHEVVPLVRRAASPDAIAWDPAAGTIDAERLEGFDAVVHLAGESVGQRWTRAVRDRVIRSRVEGTQLLCEALAAREHKPKVLVCASAIGFYGDTGECWVDENSEPGSGFLSEVCQAWEEACEPARRAGIRVVNLRIGAVLSPLGGMLGELRWPASLGLGGPIGSGRQYVGWIDRDDLLGAVLHVIRNESLIGPVNAVSPEPVTQRVFARTLGRVLRRPAFLPLPSSVIELLFGAMGREVLLAGQRVRPTRLQSSGFRFDFAWLEDSLRYQFGRCGEDAVARAAAAFDKQIGAD